MKKNIYNVVNDLSIMYVVKQSRTKQRFLLPDKTIIDTYKFVDYLDALKFAVNEQIKIIEVHFNTKQESKVVKRKVFELLYTLPQFKKVAKANPLFYIGTHKHKAVDLDKYYFYLVNTTNLLSSSNKLRKFICPTAQVCDTYDYMR